MQTTDDLIVVTLPAEPAEPEITHAPTIDLAARRKASVRTGLILASVAASFFVGIILKYSVLGH